ncbi:MAG: HPr family phosphocarrier protein [Eubacteriales bacterium]
MKKIDYIIKNSIGLHARPAAIFVKKANEFISDIKVLKDNKEANAKSIINVMSLGAIKGSEVSLQAKGDDEDEALEALTQLLDSFVDEY